MSRRLRITQVHSAIKRERSQGRTVKRLQRVQIGRIKLGELRPGKWRTLTESEIKSLLS